MDKLSFKDSYLGKLRSIVGTRTLIVPGFRIIVEDAEGRILFIRRSDNGMWGLPAGSPELAESIEDCVRREVLEETGLTVKRFECFGFASNPKTETHTYPNGDQIQNFTLLLFSRVWNGRAAVSDDETTEVRFLSSNELPPMDQVLQHEFGSIRLYAEFKETGKFQWA